MKKSFVIYITALVLLVTVFASCTRNNKGPTIHVTDPTTSSTTVSTTTEASTEEQSLAPTESQTETTTILTEPDISVPDETNSVSEDEEVMLVSADPSNQYINAVVQKYGIDPSNLVAFYASSMQTDGNLVLEFDGSLNQNGTKKRTTSTLKNIYTVDHTFTAKKATGTAAEGNEYTKKESLYCEYFVKWVVFRIYSKEIANA